MRSVPKRSPSQIKSNPLCLSGQAHSIENKKASEMARLKSSKRRRKLKKAGKMGAAVTLGRLGGEVGGPRRDAVLSKKRKRKIAQMGAAAKHGYKYRGR